jgi:hypothetical protein
MDIDRVQQEVSEARDDLMCEIGEVKDKFDEINEKLDALSARVTALEEPKIRFPLLSPAVAVLAILVMVIKNIN